MKKLFKVIKGEEPVLGMSMLMQWSENGEI